jgi:hypothetical protein
VAERNNDRFPIALHQRSSGPYAAMVDDPDGNVVLLTSDNALNLK